MQGKQNMIGQNVAFPRNRFKARYTGTTALKAGMALCYNADYGTATDFDAHRMYDVELPNQTNNKQFAGVVVGNVPASSNGSTVTLDGPGGVADILVGIATTVNGAPLTAVLGRGIFGAAGCMGRGTATPLATTPTASTTSAPGPLNSAPLSTLAISANGTTVTLSSFFTNAVVGDILVVLGGSTTASGAAACNPGYYRITTATSANACEVGTEIFTGVALAAAATVASGYLIRGYGTVPAYLHDGKESGLVEWISVITDGSGTTAVPLMVGGKSILCGGITLANGDAIDTLADGQYIGQEKSILLNAALTTNDFQVTVTTGEQLDGTTDLGGMEFDGALDESYLVWTGQHWRLTGNKGTGLS